MSNVLKSALLQSANFDHKLYSLNYKLPSNYKSKNNSFSHDKRHEVLATLDSNNRPYIRLYQRQEMIDVENDIIHNDIDWSIIGLENNFTPCLSELQVKKATNRTYDEVYKNNNIFYGIRMGVIDDLSDETESDDNQKKSLLDFQGINKFDYDSMTIDRRRRTPIAANYCWGINLLEDQDVLNYLNDTGDFETSCNRVYTDFDVDHIHEYDITTFDPTYGLDGVSSSAKQTIRIDITEGLIKFENFTSKSYSDTKLGIFNPFGPNYPSDRATKITYKERNSAAHTFTNVLETTPYMFRPFLTEYNEMDTYYGFENSRIASASRRELKSLLFNDDFISKNDIDGDFILVHAQEGDSEIVENGPQMCNWLNISTGGFPFGSFITITANQFSKYTGNRIKIGDVYQDYTLNEKSIFTSTLKNKEITLKKEFGKRKMKMDFKQEVAIKPFSEYIYHDICGETDGDGIQDFVEDNSTTRIPNNRISEAIEEGALAYGINYNSASTASLRNALMIHTKSPISDTDGFRPCSPYLNTTYFTDYRNNKFYDTYCVTYNAFVEFSESSLCPIYHIDDKILLKKLIKCNHRPLKEAAYCDKRFNDNTKVDLRDFRGYSSKLFKEFKFMDRIMEWLYCSDLYNDRLPDYTIADINEIEY